MKNIMLTGIGGQGTVLAAKVLAQAAETRGWHVRTAETIGMAQRGGSVVSHVRMGNLGETVASPLIPNGQAELVIAFEPGEAARVRGFLAPGGKVISAARAVQPVTAALAGSAYTTESATSQLKRLYPDVVIVDQEPILAEIGNPKALNIVLLAVAAATGALNLPIDELKAAVAACVKPKFVDMNLAAIDHVTSLYN